MPKGHHRSGRSFKVETRHPTRRSGRNPHVSALEGPTVHEDYQPFPDDLPERDIRADLIPSPQMRRAEALFQKPGTAPARPPMSPRVEAVFRQQLAPKGPIVQDDKTQNLQAPQPQPSQAPVRRILPNLLQAAPDPLQVRLTEAATRKPRHAITALEAARAEAINRRAPTRQGKKLAALERKAQQSFNFESVAPKPVKPKVAIETQWPDDAAIAARQEPKPISVTSREAAVLATRRTTKPTPGAINLTGPTRVVARSQYVRRTHQYNPQAVEDALKHVARAKPGNANAVKHHMPKYEHWKLRRLPPAMWNR